MLVQTGRKSELSNDLTIPLSDGPDDAPPPPQQLSSLPASPSPDLAVDVNPTAI